MTLRRSQELDRQLQGQENRLFLLLLCFSILGHIGAYALSGLNMLSKTELITQEWSIDVDIAGDLPDQSALPEAAKAKEAAVPKRMLPQLPKAFDISEPKQEGEVIAEKADKAKSPAKEGKDERTEASISQKKKNNANKIKMQDALKRLALEELRKNKKFDKRRRTAPVKSALARIAEEAKKQQKKLAKQGKIGAGAIGRYNGVLTQHIRRHYNIPHTFSSPIADPKVVVHIVINAQGQLLSLKVAKSSKDPAFDELTLEAARKAAPFAVPPKRLVGKPIELHFTR